MGTPATLQQAAERYLAKKHRREFWKMIFQLGTLAGILVAAWLIYKGI